MKKYYKRKLYEHLEAWRGKKDRKPLIIRGARQVGKTTLVGHFGRTFKHFIHLNLEKKEYRTIFEKIDRISAIVNAIFLQTNTPRDGKDTLIFIDEIQESPQAIRQLRFFYEEYPDIHLIAAGSLLEFAFADLRSFPVGRVEQVVLHPFDFEEFLWAADETEASVALTRIPIDEYAFQRLMSLFHDYAVIGGMPAVVAKYIADGTMANLSEIYDNLWLSYINDIAKYATGTTNRNVLRYVIEAAIATEDRITFTKFANQKFSARAITSAFRLWEQTRLIRLLYPVTGVKLPVAPDPVRKPRLQFLDTGLMNARLGIQAQMIGLEDLNELASGRIIQHLVVQEVIAQHHSPLYLPAFWVREKVNSTAEVDLVIPVGSHLLPVEVKSGPQGRLRSLHQFMDRTDHPYAIRLLANHFSVENVTTPGGTPYQLMNLPYFLAGKLQEYGKWFMESS